MFAAERAEVVFTATSRQGRCYQVIRGGNHTYAIEIDGLRVEALYWRTGELDRCVQVVEQLIADESRLSAAAP